MADRDTLPDHVKPYHYALSIRDMNFKDWSYQGTVRYVSYPAHLITRRLHGRAGR